MLLVLVLVLEMRVVLVDDVRLTHVVLVVLLTAPIFFVLSWHQGISGSGRSEEGGGGGG
jgi:hypothetical protein